MASSDHDHLDVEDSAAPNYFKGGANRTTRDFLFYGSIFLNLVLAIAIIVVTTTHKSTDPPAPLNGSCHRPLVYGKNGMVSTTNNHATDAGLAILQAGGNAFDAAAAIQFMLTLVQPQSTGIGGGCLIMMYKAATKQILALDGREEAPALYNATSFCKNSTCLFDPNCGCDDGAWAFRDRTTGGHPVGVPGVIRAVSRMLDEHGTMTLARTAAPAIAKARAGFPMYNELNRQLTLNKDRLSIFPASVKLYLSNNGDPIPVGQTFTNPDLAKTLELIGEKGADVFYSGELADDILNTVLTAKNPTTGLYGVMRKSDLMSYKAVYRQHVQTTYRGYTIAGMNMPSAGGSTLALMLNLLENFDLSTMTPGDTEWLHRVIDAQDIAFADRGRYMGDADFVDVPVNGLLQKSYAKARMQTLAKSLQGARAAAGGSVQPGVPQGGQKSHDKYAQAKVEEKKSTTHLVVADRWGNVVSMTTTLEENLGSAVVVPNRGFLLNNELTDFQELPVDKATGLPFANGPEGGKKIRRTSTDTDKGMGGKRPMSSMTPTIVFQPGPDDSLLPFMAVGSPGGSRITGQVLNALLPVLDNNWCVSDAIDLPRTISMNSGNTEIEAPMLSNKRALDMLAARGFQIQVLNTTRPLGYVESLLVRRNPTDGSRTYEGAADSVRMPPATAAGY